jgi:hypothetical protein
MATGTKTERVTNFVPTNLEGAQAAYDDLMQVVGLVRKEQSDVAEKFSDKETFEIVNDWALDQLADWFDRHTGVGYKGLVYTLWYVRDNLVPVWLGGTEAPKLTSAERTGTRRNVPAATTAPVVKEPESWEKFIQF